MGGGGGGRGGGWAVKLAIGVQHPVVAAILILGPFGLVYLGGVWLLRVPEAAGAVTRLARMAGWKRR